MSEAGVDISQHKSKHVNDLNGLAFDYVVTVCDDANEACPIFPGNTKVVHVGFDDPPRLARVPNPRRKRCCNTAAYATRSSHSSRHFPKD